MPQTLPIAPSTGPPAAWPTASAWPVIESTVARTLESVICWFSQIDHSGRDEHARSGRRRAARRSRRRAELVSAKASCARMTSAVAARRSRASFAVPSRSKRFRSAPTAKNANTIATRRQRAEPDDGLEAADRRQADVADEVRLLEAVERLGAHAAEQRDRRRGATSSGLPRMKRAPLDAVAPSSRKALPLSRRAARRSRSRA